MRGTRWAGLVFGLFLLGGCAQAPATPTATLVPPVAPTQVQAPTATAPAAAVATATARPESTTTPAGTAVSGNAATTVAAPVPAQAAAPAGALFLTVTSPADDLVEVPAGTRTVVVAGTSAPDALVSVNGVVAGMDATGAFQVTVPLDEDVTLLEVVASDTTGKEVQTDRIVVQE